MKEIIRTVINVGLEKPVKLLQITDVHVTRYSEDDPDFQKELSARRVDTFKNEGRNKTEEYLEEAFEIAKQENAIPVLTGDIIDLHTKGNIEYFQNFIKDKELLFTPGGHEYQRVCVRTMEEGEEYVSGIKAKMKEEFSRFDLEFSSHIIGGVNIIMANNALDYYSAYTVECFEKELERGLPIIVFSHNPINDSMMGLTESYHPKVKLTAKDYETSNRMLKALWEDNRVVTTVAGHLHKNEEFEAFGKRHYTTDGLFRGICRLIEIV